MVSKFKATFHNMHIHAKGDVEGVWYDLHYLVTEDYFLKVMKKWSPAWLAPITPTKSRIGIQTMKPTKKVTEKEATPTTTGEPIDLEKETEPQKNGSC